MAAAPSKDSKPGPGALDLRRVKHTLDEIFSHYPDTESLIPNLLQFALRLVNGGAASFEVIEDATLITKSCIVSDSGAEWNLALRDILRQNSQKALGSKEVTIDSVTVSSVQSPVALISVPVLIETAQPQVFSVAIKVGQQRPEVFVVIMQLITASFSLWLQGKGSAVTRKDTDALHQLIQTVVAGLECKEKKQSGHFFVQALKEFFNADLLLFAPNSSLGGQPILHSSLLGFNEQSPQMKLVKQVAAECKLLKKMLVWPQMEVLRAAINSFVLRDLTASFFTGYGICLPLLDNDDEFQGSIIICWTDKPEELEEKLVAFSEGQELITSFVKWLRNQQMASTSALKDTWFNQRLRTLLFLGVAVVVLCIGFVPVSFKIDGNCILEPEKTRIVVAQFDGVLKKVLKTPGSRVEKGELLALFDEKKIELEINSILANIEKSQKLQDVHTATGKAALAQMAGLEKRALKEKLKLFRQRLSQLSVLSPVEGIVISKNLERAEGTPIAKGKGLFEIAPLETMVAEAHISQEDIGFVQEQAETRLRLDSFPAKSWHSSVHTIFPRSELRDGRNVFLVESLVNNDQGLLKPGMAGRISITSGKKPLLWKLFRKPWVYFQKTFLTQ